MRAKDLLLGGTILAASIFSILQIASCSKDRNRLHTAPAGHSQIWRCRGNGFETNLTPEQVGAAMSSGRTRRDPANPYIELLPCPDCGKVELESITKTPTGEVKG